ncbi:hypothetical protein BCB4_0074 [Bacillus phage B4]|uniref:Uncharacterized protein n=2 Tax=Bequatrovirus B4 TaxID=1918005 RepID=J9PQT2_9CAUD|nr:hypothetical protein BCB4_0074 [Bacillus phage B4]YP_009783669.1 hypothetical protein QLX26_gp073 [Bacillus phage B5S]AEW47307.1 hypothetical protein B5S_0073 [Bacillus phage B5S]AEZ65867.1 hypothetical protein BCB4_0074 [Bacillus phage B4]
MYKFKYGTLQPSDVINVSEWDTGRRLAMLLTSGRYLEFNDMMREINDYEEQSIVNIISAMRQETVGSNYNGY